MECLLCLRVSDLLDDFGGQPSVIGPVESDDLLRLVLSCDDEGLDAGDIIGCLLDRVHLSKGLICWGFLVN